MYVQVKDRLSGSCAIIYPNVKPSGSMLIQYQVSDGRNQLDHCLSLRISQVEERGRMPSGHNQCVARAPLCQ